MRATKKKLVDTQEASAPAQKTAAPKGEKGANVNVKKSPVGLLMAAAATLVVLVAVVAYMNMGSLAKGLVERIATNTLGVKVTLATLDIMPAEKTVMVSGLKIANPQDFKNPDALTIGKIGIAAESLSPELLVFRKIDVESTDINLEVTENATNLTAIQKNVNRQAAAQTGDAQQKQPPKVIVRELVFNGMKLNPSATLLGDDMMPVEISGLRMTGIGEKENGALVSEAIAQVLDQLTRTSLEAGMQAGYLQGMTPEALGDIRNQFGIANGFREQAKQGLESLKSGIKNLFGGSDEAAPAPAPTPETQP